MEMSLCCTATPHGDSWLCPQVGTRVPPSRAPSSAPFHVFHPQGNSRGGPGASPALAALVWGTQWGPRGRSTVSAACFAGQPRPFSFSATFFGSRAPSCCSARLAWRGPGFRRPGRSWWPQEGAWLLPSHPAPRTAGDRGTWPQVTWETPIPSPMMLNRQGKEETSQPKLDPVPLGPSHVPQLHCCHPIPGAQ